MDTIFTVTRGRNMADSAVDFSPFSFTTFKTRTVLPPVTHTVIHAVAQDGKKAVLTEKKDQRENKLDIGLHLLNGYYGYFFVR